MAPPLTLPVTFPVPGEPATASYTWTELASGEGYVRWYMVGTNPDGTTNNVNRILTTNNQETAEQISGAVHTGGATITIDSSTFNLPRTADGNALITLYGQNKSGGTTAFTLTIKIQKWDGSTATDISSNSSSYRDLAVNAYGRFTFAVDLTRTKIKKGESLRLSVTIPSSLYLIGNTPTYPNAIDIPFDIDL